MHRLSPPSWITLFPFVLFVDLPRGFLFLAFVDNPLDWFQASRAPAPHDGADHTRVKQSEIDNPFVTLVSRRG